VGRDAAVGDHHRFPFPLPGVWMAS
jgi:hypothetical protein